MPSCTSPPASASTLPISWVIVRVSSGLRSRRSSATRNRISARFGAGYRRQLAYASCAAATARSASAAVERGNDPITSPVAGFVSSNRSPLSESTQSPAM